MPVILDGLIGVDAPGYGVDGVPIDERDEDWIAPTLINGWSNFGGGYAPAGFYRAVDGRVYLRGMVTDGAISGSTSGDIFLLPSGYAPSNRMIFAVNAGNALGRVDISGQSVRAVNGAAGWFNLSGISFRVGE